MQDPSMSNARLRRISYVFPKDEPASQGLFEALVQLIGDLPQAAVREDLLLQTPLQPVGALPETGFQLADVPLPQVEFTPAVPWSAGTSRLQLGADPGQPPAGATLGGARLSPGDLARRLRGHVTRVDHTGINLVGYEVSRWEDLLRQVASTAALYRYPGEDWPFILPTTQEEFAGDIREFVPGREPKFELVRDLRMNDRVLQIDLGTDLPRAEIEARFPDPEGMALPGTEEFFRSVYAAHPWPRLGLRFDLRFRGEGYPSTWDTGEWLVTQGGRIRGG